MFICARRCYCTGSIVASSSKQDHDYDDDDDFFMMMMVMHVCGNCKTRYCFELAVLRMVARMYAAPTAALPNHTRQYFWIVKSTVCSTAGVGEEGGGHLTATAAYYVRHTDTSVNLLMTTNCVSFKGVCAFQLD